MCSWSLQPRSPRHLCELLAQCGVSAVQLALDPLRVGHWEEARTVELLREAGVETLSGMMAMEGEDYSSIASIRATGGVRPAARHAANLRAARENAALAARLGLGLVSFHAGFLPESRADPERAAMVGRLREIADVFAAQDVAVALETGQEPAATLLDVLDELDRPTVGVNFDPANLRLYDTDEPVAALALLAPRVLQVHVKDARRSGRPGVWGEELPAGTGEVDWPEFFATLHAARLQVDLLVEREAGAARVADVRTALALIARHGRAPAAGRRV